MIEIRHQAIQRGQSIQDAYDELYQERTLLMRDSFYLWLIELAHPPAGGLLVDVACGNGRLVELAAAQGIRALGVELSFAGIARAAAAAPPPASWLIADGETLPLSDAGADRVLSIGSLEHYDDPRTGATELARILKPDGRACILLPNAYGLFGNIQHVWQTGEVFDDGQPRQRYATRATWQTLLEQAGLQVERAVTWGEDNWPRTPADWLWFVRRPQRILRGTVAGAVPVNLANQIIFLCRRAPAPRRDYVPTLPL